LKRSALRADEYEALLLRLGEPFQVTAQLVGQLGWEVHGPSAGTRLRSLGQQITAVQLGGRLYDPNLTLFQIDAGPPERDQLAPPQNSERR
jgi:hypothetical protein